MKSIKGILEGIYTNQHLRETCIPLFVGNPGIGKTWIIENFAKEKKARLITIIASQLMPHEISGMALPDKAKKKMTYFDYDMFASLKDGDIIFFDELLNANPMVLNACLTVLENRTLISGTKLPNVMIVAAANHQGSAILTPQIKQRFIWYGVSYDTDMYKEYLTNKYGISYAMFNLIDSKIREERFDTSGQNYYTPRSIEKTINMAISGVESPYKDLEASFNELIENTSEKTININKYKFKPGEKKEWIKLKQLEYGVIKE